MNIQSKTRFEVRRDLDLDVHSIQAVDAEAAQILVVDDHALLRRGLAMTIAVQFPDITVIEAGSLREALDKARRLGPLKAVIYDLGLPDADGVLGLRRLLDEVGPAPAIVISASPAPDIAADCIRAGASGFLPKWCNAEVLEHALPLVLNGGIYTPQSSHPYPPPAALGAPSPVRQDFQPNSRGEDEVMAHPAEDQPLLGSLTGRQREVLQLLIAGLSNKEIARKLGVLEGTVKVHVRAIMQQLNARNRTQVVMVAVRAGLVVQSERSFDRHSPTVLA